MSNQDLRDLLEAELAEISDSDGDLSDDCLDYYNLGIHDGEQEPVGFADGIDYGDVKSLHIQDIEEWQQLIESSQQMEARICGLQLSDAVQRPINSEENVGYESITSSKSRAGLKTSSRTLIDQSDTLLDKAAADNGTPSCSIVSETSGDSINMVYVTPSEESADGYGNKYFEEPNLSWLEKDDQQNVPGQDSIDFEELRELLKYMVDAVERSAPIVLMPRLEVRQTVVDFSLLPQLILDTDSDFVPTQSHSCEDDEVATFIRENDADIDLSLRSQQVLKDSVDSLRAEADFAKSEANDRKEKLRERIRLMNEELREFRERRICQAPVSSEHTIKPSIALLKLSSSYLRITTTLIHL